MAGKSRKNPPASTFWCSRCERKIRMPKGWSIGAGTRRHYWSKHRDVMLPRVGRSR